MRENKCIGTGAGQRKARNESAIGKWTAGTGKRLGGRMALGWAGERVGVGVLD